MQSDRKRAVAASGEKLRAPRGALAAVSLAMLLSSLGTSIANVGLPAMGPAFGASFQQVQWVVLAYLLAITVLIVSVGRLGDIVGRRRLLLIGLGLFMLASIACGAAPTLAVLIAARAAQGLAAAIMMALSMAIVGEIVPKERAGSAMGLLGTMSAVGTALGPSLGGALIAASGWRAIFLAAVPLAVFAFVLAYRYLPSHAPATDRQGKPRLDIRGTALLGLALLAYALATTLGRGGFGPLNAALLAAAIVGFCLFIFAETRTASPLVRPAMLRDPSLAAGLAMSTLVSTVIMATLVVGPFYLSRSLGLNAALVGFAMSTGPVVSALAGWPAGRLVDRFGSPRTTVVGLLAMMAGSLALAMLPIAFGLGAYVTPLAIMTAGYALFQAANNTAVMAGIPPDQRGLTAGLLNLSRNLGLTTGASVMGAIFAAMSGASDITAASADATAIGMQAAFATATGLIVVALAVAAAKHIAASRPASPVETP